MATAKEEEPWEGGCCLLCSIILDAGVLLCRGWMWHYCTLDYAGNADHPLAAEQGTPCHGTLWAVGVSWVQKATGEIHSKNMHGGLIAMMTLILCSFHPQGLPETQIAGTG